MWYEISLNVKSLVLLFFHGLVLLWIWVVREKFPQLLTLGLFAIVCM